MFNLRSYLLSTTSILGLARVLEPMTARQVARIVARAAQFLPVTVGPAIEPLCERSNQ